MGLLCVPAAGSTNPIVPVVGMGKSRAISAPVPLSVDIKRAPYSAIGIVDGSFGFPLQLLSYLLAKPLEILAFVLLGAIILVPGANFDRCEPRCWRSSLDGAGSAGYVIFEAIQCHRMEVAADRSPADARGRTLPTRCHHPTLVRRDAAGQW